jgi:hypothetical protein
MDALADALRAAGVAPDRIASILGTAATATMHALVLETLSDEIDAPAADTSSALPGIEPLRTAA